MENLVKLIREGNIDRLDLYIAVAMDSLMNQWLHAGRDMDRLNNLADDVNEISMELEIYESAGNETVGLRVGTLRGMVDVFAALLLERQKSILGPLKPMKWAAADIDMLEKKVDDLVVAGTSGELA